MALNTPTPVISRFNLILAWLSWAALCPLGLVLLDVSVLRAGMLGAAHPWGWSWMGFLLANLGYMIGTVYTARLLGSFFVSFSEHGLRFITLTGAREMSWSSIQDVRVQPPLVVLRGGSYTVRLNQYCYTRPNELMPFLRRVLPPFLLAAKQQDSI